MRVLIAGATGALGSYLVPALVAGGHSVVGSSRSADTFDRLRSWGAEPVQMDGLDAASVRRAVRAAEPEVVVHQMTALAGKPDFRHFDRMFAQTNRLRTEGTDLLLAAAQEAGAVRFVAQSYTGWPNERTGGPVKTERDPLDPKPPAGQAETLAAIRHVEQVVPAATGITGLVLRYGGLYGPNAIDEMLAVVRKRQFPIVGGGTGIWSFVHLQDAATATVEAVQRGRAGSYNVCDDEPAPVSEWLPYLADVLGTRAPLRIPRWLGRLVAGDALVGMMTESRGSDNALAKSEFGWQPVWPSWRQGFRDGLSPSAGPMPGTGRPESAPRSGRP